MLENFKIKVENHLDFDYRGVIGFGSCLPKGAVQNGDALHLEDGEGRSYPLEWRPLACTETGEVRWAYFSVPLDLRPGQFRHLRVVPGSAPAYEGLHVEARDGMIVVKNGQSEIEFKSGTPLGLAILRYEGHDILHSRGMDAHTTCTDGSVYRVREPLKLTLKSANAVEAVIQAQGELERESRDTNDSISIRLLYKIKLGQPGLDINCYFSNCRASDDELVFQSMAMDFGLAAPIESCIVRQISYDNLCLPRDHEIAGGVTIRNGALTDGEVLEQTPPDQLWPFFKKLGNRGFFERVAPHVGLKLPDAGVVFAWQRAAELQTNSFTAHGEGASLELIVAGAEGWRIPQGFSRSFDFSITPLERESSGEDVFRVSAAAEYRPLLAVHPQWYIENGVEEMERTLPYLPQQHPRFEKQLWREFAKGYFSGFYHTGDYPSGRGPAQSRAEATVYTWNNNEEDNLKGIALQYMRTGDPTYFEDLTRCGRHLLEVDRMAYSSHALQSGVLIAHAPAHFDGAGYPSHCWAEGLLLYYKLTGEDDALEAFFQMCDCLLHWTEIPVELRFTDAREMGVPLTNFAHAYAMTGSDKYLRAAQMYIREFRRQMAQDGGLYYRKGGMSTLYSEYVAIEGLWDFYELVGESAGEEAVGPLLLDIIDWIYRQGLDTFGVYDARATSESMLHMFYIAYRLTKDAIWLERGRPGLDAALSQCTGLPLMKFGNNGAYYHEAMRRGWFRDASVPLDPNPSHRAVNRTYSEPLFVWEKPGRTIH